MWIFTSFFFFVVDLPFISIHCFLHEGHMWFVMGYIYIHGIMEIQWYFLWDFGIANQ